MAKIHRSGPYNKATWVLIGFNKEAEEYQVIPQMFNSSDECDRHSMSLSRGNKDWAGFRWHDMRDVIENLFAD